MCPHSFSYASCRDAAPPEWAHGVARAGTEATGMAETGAVGIGMAAIGTGIGITGTWNNWNGNWHYNHGYNDVISLVVSALHGGVRADILTGATMVMAIGTVITAVMAANTALPLGRESLSYNGDSPALVVIAGQSMESSGLRRGEQYAPTRRTKFIKADSVRIF